MARVTTPKTSRTTVSHDGMASTAQEPAIRSVPTTSNIGVMYLFCQATDRSARLFSSSVIVLTVAVIFGPITRPAEESCSYHDLALLVVRRALKGIWLRWPDLFVTVPRGPLSWLECIPLLSPTFRPEHADCPTDETTEHPSGEDISRVVDTGVDA